MILYNLLFKAPSCVCVCVCANITAHGGVLRLVQSLNPPPGAVFSIHTCAVLPFLVKRDCTIIMQ